MMKLIMVAQYIYRAILFANLKKNASRKMHSQMIGKNFNIKQDMDPKHKAR